MTSSNNNSILDTPSSRYMKLQIQYGSEFYEILLSNKEQKLRVEDVLDAIEKLTKVPKCHQSIMYKGQRLDQKPNANLDDLYIFNNSKLILTGTQKQFHDKYCCPDHDHQTTTNISKSTSSQQQTSLHSTSVKEEKAKKDIDADSATKISIPLAVPIKQEMCSNLVGFVPEPNKTYEYYTVPYKTDPTTLFQTIPPSTSNTHGT